MVVAAHFLPNFVVTGLPEIVASSFGPGGVLLFFLLSGYLIFRNLQRQTLPVFVLRRFAKLFPAYWFNILVILFMGYYVADYPRFSTMAYVANFLMMPDIFHQALISGVFWTLIIEIKFYVLVALQYRFLRGRHVLVVPSTILLMNLAFWFAFERGSVLLTYLPVFYIGIEIYRAEAAAWAPAALRRLAAVTLTIGASMLLFVQYSSVETALYIPLQAAFFVWALKASWHRLWLSFIGRISYSLYLYHGVLGYEVLRHFAGGNAPMWLLVPAAFVVSFLAAYLSFLWIEEPGVRFGKRIEQRWLPHKALPAH